MSLNQPPVKVLVNNTNGVMSITNGVITFVNLKGINPFTVANVEQAERVCSSACVSMVRTVTPAVPSTPCECPWTWTITITMRQCLDFRTDHIYGRQVTFSHQDPAGEIPTVSEIVDAIVDEINADPYRTVTATKTGSPGSYTAFVITERDCTSATGTCGFDVDVTLGTVVETTPSTRPQLDYYALKQIFAERPGYFWGSQEGPVAGDSYCLYRMRVFHGQTNGPHLANERADRFMTYEFYVRRDATMVAQWDNPLVAELPSLGVPLT